MSATLPPSTASAPSATLALIDCSGFAVIWCNQRAFRSTEYWPTVFIDNGAPNVKPSALVGDIVASGWTLRPQPSMAAVQCWRVPSNDESFDPVARKQPYMQHG